MVEMRTAGKTTEGREWKYVLISSPENLKNIDHYKAISQQLAHPENLSREEAQKLAAEGKAIVDISGGLHASEIAGNDKRLRQTAGRGLLGVRKGQTPLVAVVEQLLIARITSYNVCYTKLLRTGRNCGALPVSLSVYARSHYRCFRS